MMTSDNVPDQVEPEPGPLIERPHAVEGFEDRLAMFCGDTWAGIRNTQRAIAAHPHSYCGFVAAVDYRILDEVDDGARERSGVTSYGDVFDFGIEGNLIRSVLWRGDGASETAFRSQPPITRAFLSICGPGYPSRYLGATCSSAGSIYPRATA